MTHSSRTDAISNEFQNFLADIEALLKETASLSGDELSHARGKISKRVASAKEAAINLGGDIADSASKVAATANREVHAEPWKAIGAGAAIGLLLGLVIARR